MATRPSMERSTQHQQEAWEECSPPGYLHSVPENSQTVPNPSNGTLTLNTGDSECTWEGHLRPLGTTTALSPPETGLANMQGFSLDFVFDPQAGLTLLSEGLSLLTSWNVHGHLYLCKEETDEKAREHLCLAQEWPPGLRSVIRVNKYFHQREDE